MIDKLTVQLASFNGRNRRANKIVKVSRTNSAAEVAELGGYKSF
jgi:hypothetical protein